MKNCFFVLLAIVAFSACSQVEKGGLIQIDLEKDYPSREFVLQDLWKVKYVPMETDSVYLLGGGHPWYASDNLLGFVDNRTGSLLFFDAKTGAKSFHINRKGGGPGEYVGAGAIVVDEAKDEVFVWSIYGGAFLVYDKNGKYLRSLPLHNYKKGEFADIACVVDFDGTSLLCSSNDLKGYALLYFLDKQTGETTMLDSIGKEKYVSPFLMKQTDEGVVSVAPKIVPMVKTIDGFIYADHSSDTIFKMRGDVSMQPWVVRHPSVKSSDPIKLLRYNDETEDWIFLSSVEMSFNFESGKGLPQKCYAVHKQTHEIVEATFVNEDYAGMSPELSFDGCTCLGADKLMDALDEGRLSGELKVLAEELDVEDNPVVMIRTRK